MGNKYKISLLVLTFIFLCSPISAQKETALEQINIETIKTKIQKGDFQKAQNKIKNLKYKFDLPDSLEQQLTFLQKRMQRIEMDFNKTEEDIKNSLQEYYPDLSPKMLSQWEENNHLEMKVINGKKHYFHNSVPNLFRIDSSAQKVKRRIKGKKVDSLDLFCNSHTEEILQDLQPNQNNILNPVTMKINFTLTVKPGTVPPGETIRCWMPYPKRDNKRQKNINLISTNVDEYIISPENRDHSTIYMEKEAQKGKPTIFSYTLSYTSYAEKYDLSEYNFDPYDKDSKLYKKYTQERPPHIIFSERVKNLTESIIQNETNPYKKVLKIYKWIDNNIPWASAREYSTIKSIPKYVLNNKHGDCGLKTLLFISMARYAGIPAKWQSGWMMHPGEVNLHDWAVVYFPPIGWVPVDQSFGVQDSQKKKHKYFYTSGIDSYRLIVNDNYSQPFFPLKVHLRSETVDFQRGEVEWKGDNLYFDKWDYNMEVNYQK